jgi:hypothetical protein
MNINNFPIKRSVAIKIIAYVLFYAFAYFLGKYIGQEIARWRYFI